MKPCIFFLILPIFGVGKVTATPKFKNYFISWDEPTSKQYIDRIARVVVHNGGTITHRFEILNGFATIAPLAAINAVKFETQRKPPVIDQVDLRGTLDVPPAEMLVPVVPRHPSYWMYGRPPAVRPTPSAPVRPPQHTYDNLRPPPKKVLHSDLKASANSLPRPPPVEVWHSYLNDYSDDTA